jgi:cytoskeletal protein CcmA (bactofilin family)
MFGKKQRRHAVVETLIGSNSKVNGDLHFKGACHVDGTVNGNVTADPDTESALSISDIGTIDGGVTVPYVVLNGIVRGDVSLAMCITI